MIPFGSQCIEAIQIQDLEGCWGSLGSVSWLTRPQRCHEASHPSFTSDRIKHNNREEITQDGGNLTTQNMTRDRWHSHPPAVSHVPMVTLPGLVFQTKGFSAGQLQPSWSPPSTPISFLFCPIFIFATLWEPRVSCSSEKVIKLFLGRELI